jgi:hypothetical protein
VDVVDDDDQRPGAGEGADQLQERPAGLVAGVPVLDAHRAPQAARHGRRDADRGRQIVERAIAGRLHDDLAQRPVGDAVTVGGAGAGEDRPALAGDRGQLGDEPRLADAGLSDDRHHLRGVLGDDTRERLAQTADLLVATDQRAVEPPPDRRGVEVQRFQQQAAVHQRGRARGMAHEPPRRLGDEDLAVGGAPCEPFGVGHGLADHRRGGVLACGRDHVVSAAFRDDGAVAQCATQPRRHDLDRVARVLRPRPFPQLVDDAVEVDDRAAVHQQQGEERERPSAWDARGAASHVDLDRPEDPELALHLASEPSRASRPCVGVR